MDSCTYHFSWDSRAACAVKPQEVQMVNGTITNPATGRSFSLGDIYFKSVEHFPSGRGHVFRSLPGRGLRDKEAQAFVCFSYCFQVQVVVKFRSSRGQALLSYWMWQQRC